MNLGDKIRQLREERRLTQGHLATHSSVSQGYLSQLENGEVKNPSAAVLLRVAQPQISALVNGRAASFSHDRLVDLAERAALSLRMTVTRPYRRG